MAVRLKVKLKVRKGISYEVETVAIANTGFEAEGLEVVVPESLARRMGFLPEFPQGTRVEDYVSASGLARAYVISQALEIEVLALDIIRGPVVADAVILDTDEILLSDKMIEELNIILEKPGSWLWRFSDEPSSTLRRSEPAEKW